MPCHPKTKTENRNSIVTDLIKMVYITSKKKKKQKDSAGSPVGIDCKVQSCNLERCVQVRDGGGIDSGEDRGDRTFSESDNIF